MTYALHTFECISNAICNVYCLYKSFKYLFCTFSQLVNDTADICSSHFHYF